MSGIPAQDTWTDIDPINMMAPERLGYPTQKPQALLERIIQASSNEGHVAQQILDHVARVKGRPLTPQEENLVLDQATAIGELSEPEPDLAGIDDALAEEALRGHGPGRPCRTPAMPIPTRSMTTARALWRR